MASKPRAKPAKRSAAPKKNGYKLPDPIPHGEVLQEISKRKWRIGPPIGVGGFGAIYSACDDGSPKSSKQYPFAIKIEPHDNGPLFVEMHFYMKNAKKEDIEAFKNSRNLTSIGMPIYLGTGSHEYKGTKYRFLVLEKFGKDLWKIFLENNRKFPIHTVFKLGIQMLDVLEYIHERSYIHGDIKGQNILLGIKKGDENQAYLVDFGLANRYTEKEFKYNPKRAHDGTIEYTSRDAHMGVQTRRGDMEILAYNMVQWICGSLPWEKDLKKAENVKALKEKYMSNIPDFISTCFGEEKAPASLVSFLEYVQNMKYDEKPDYKKCRKLFEAGIKSCGYPVDCGLDFSPSKNRKRKSNLSLQSDQNEEAESEDDLPLKRKVIRKKVIRKPSVKAKTPSRLSANSKSTQTSIEKTKKTRTSSGTSNSPLLDVKPNDSILDNSPDIIDATPSPKNKLRKTRRVLYNSIDEEVSVRKKTVVKKRLATAKSKSWRDIPTVTNGKSVKV